ncbi:hypothetical protein [Aliarcobacter butzleri]|uniref:hypothetical protein n=1 Tax=Aliarcobacter butzleri TaxID=28197 RepID=UPI0012600A14|nr:hypothetical protein [Aliarcobacter butzleri]
MFSNMKPAEKRLLEACKKGEVLNLADERPRKKTDNNEIRGEFLRALILSNNQEIIDEKWEKYILKIDPKGIQFSGAYISGTFDFSFCSTDLPLGFMSSIFQKQIILLNSRIKIINLGSCNIPSIDAQRVICDSDLLFRKIEVDYINFANSKIGGSFISENSSYTNFINCNGAIINGAVFLTDNLSSEGMIDFNSSNIGSLDCTNAKKIKYLNCNGAVINGSVFIKDIKQIDIIDLSLTQISANIECINSINKNFLCESSFIKNNIAFDNFSTNSLNFGLSKIDGMLKINNLTINGHCILNSSKINQLWFQKIFWKDSLISIGLDGLLYEYLDVENLNSKILLSLLNKMPKEETFKPQPYKQLAKVLRNMGHNEDANNIMIEYNDIITSKRENNFIKILKQIYGKTAGYGYKPMRVLGTMFIVWLFCSLFYWNASKVGVFAPTNPLVFQKKDSYVCNVNSNGTPLLDFFNYSKYNSSNNWILNENLEGEYTTFNPFLYSLDVILPIVDLQVEKDWGQYVSSNNGTLNDITRWLMWFEILFGWTYSLILVAILSGLAKNEKD